MLHQSLRIAELIAAAATIAGITYYIVCIWSAARFASHAASSGTSARGKEEFPSVSILKPLKGTDPEMYENFRSHCLQDYADYEIIFGVSDPGDPAVKLVKKLQAEFPQRDIRLVFCDQKLGSNTKVSNLVQMLAHARYQYLIVNDSDIRVPSDYLRRVLGPLSNSKTVMVTCPYRGVANATLGSKLKPWASARIFCREYW